MNAGRLCAIKPSPCPKRFLAGIALGFIVTRTENRQSKGSLVTYLIRGSQKDISPNVKG